MYRVQIVCTFNYNTADILSLKIIIWNNANHDLGVFKTCKYLKGGLNHNYLL